MKRKETNTKVKKQIRKRVDLLDMCFVTKDDLKISNDKKKIYLDCWEKIPKDWPIVEILQSIIEVESREKKSETGKIKCDDECFLYIEFFSTRNLKDFLKLFNWQDIFDNPEQVKKKSWVEKIKCNNNTQNL